MYFIDLISKKVKKETEEEMRSIISITYEQQSSYYAVFPFDLDRKMAKIFDHILKDATENV